MGVDELLIHQFDSIKQSGLLVDLHERFLQFVIVQILLLVLCKLLAQFSDICLCEYICFQATQLLY